MSKGLKECNKKISTFVKACYKAMSFDDSATDKGVQINNFEKAPNFSISDYENMSFSDIIRARRAEEKSFWKDLPKENTQFPKVTKENLREHINQTEKLYKIQFIENYQYYICFQPILNEVSNNAIWLENFTGSNIDFFESDYAQSFYGL